MPDSKLWKLYPLPPNWEEKYDATTKLHYYIDHVNQKTTWTDPRSWYYDKDCNSGVEHTTIQEFTADASMIQNAISRIRDQNLLRRLLASQLLVPSAVVSSSARNQRQSLSPKARPRDTISVDASLKKKKSDFPSPFSSSPQTDSRSERRAIANHFKSVPETEEMELSTSTAKSDSRPHKIIESIKSAPSDTKQAVGSKIKKKETQKQKDSSKPSRPTAHSSLYIQAMGPNYSFLVQRIPAKGPNPEFHKGHNPALVKGPNPALLIKNR
ncbi:hypothetical protein ACTXT7_000471 [Hymenolepis weldensis]